MQRLLENSLFNCLVKGFRCRQVNLPAEEILQTPLSPGKSAHPDVRAGIEFDEDIHFSDGG